ncbi:MAG: NRDE family protein [Phaeodactylibacter sp.]|nr:NRDE family protein [Phaeodactylibacter sp.]MCB9301722.1 NRDE family protein [Lewinellaceae bacterium]HQU58715.1 NRDE family protein [Saprospiraceae bacterium]
MCTVTYLPQGKNGFIFTSNRDEAPQRSPQRISRVELAGQALVFPRDETAGGTWIAISNANRMACILNGAFEKHERRPPYRRSRGLMALDFFDFPSAGAFLQEYTFQGMEPFTMVIYERGDLWEFRWDEQQQHIRQLDTTQTYIWSSAPLYGPEIRERREQWFNDWKAAHPNFDQEDILHFHHTAGEGDSWNDVVMNRNNIVRTVSVTSILKTDKWMDMTYHDLLSDAIGHEKIILKGEVVGSR